MAGAQPFGQGQAGVGGVDDPAGGLDGAVAGDDEGPVHLGDLLDRLADPAVADVALLAQVSFEGVEAQDAGPGQDVAGVADDDQAADGLAFAPLATDLDGHVDHRLEGLQRHRGLQRPEVARGKPFEVLAQADHGDRVEHLGLEARVGHHHVVAGGEQVVGHGLDQGQGDPLIDRRFAVLDGQRHQPGELDGVLHPARLDGHHQPDPLGQGADGLPVHRPLGHDQQSRRPRAGDRLAGQFQQAHRGLGEDRWRHRGATSARLVPIGDDRARAGKDSARFARCGASKTGPRG